MEDRISAKELRRRWGIDGAIFDVELRREVDWPHTNEDDPGLVGVNDPAEEGVAV